MKTNVIQSYPTISIGQMAGNIKKTIARYSTAMLFLAATILAVHGMITGAECMTCVAEVNPYLHVPMRVSKQLSASQAQEKAELKQKRIELAQFFYGEKLYPEAMSILRTMERDGTLTANAALLKAASEYKFGRTAEAKKTFARINSAKLGGMEKIEYLVWMARI